MASIFPAKAHRLAGTSFAACCLAATLMSCDSSTGGTLPSQPKSPAPKSVAIRFSPAGGYYAGAQMVAVSCSTLCKQIRYTLDGSVPTATSPLYGNPLSVWKDLSISAKAYDSTGAVIGSATASYKITGIPWNPEIAFDSFQDARDGQEYRSVRIGAQVWMAQNLNYLGHPGDTGICNQNVASRCAKFGRMYTWEQAMDGAALSDRIPSGVQGLCPVGWHLPSDPEISELVAFVESDPRVGAGKAGKALKAAQGWLVNFDTTTYGTDLFGFTALPAGYFDAPYNFLVFQFQGDWWVTKENVELSFGEYFTMDSDKPTVDRYGDRTRNSRSVRCLRD